MSDQLNEKMEGVRKEIQARLSHVPKVVQVYTTYLLKTSGKNIRAQAVLVSAMERDGSIVDDAVYVAAALEILHLATLVHDDVMDDADERRGAPTLQKKYGRKTAVIVGDYLLAVALKTLSDVSRRDLILKYQFDDVLMDLVLGELQQHIHNGDVSIDESLYYDIIKGKTASLFEGACFAGACLKETDSSESYRALGSYIGMLFQIKDDILDFKTSAKIALKPVASDYEQGVVTLPLIHALHQNPKSQMDLDSMTKKEMAHYVTESGGITYAQQQAQQYYANAKDILDSLDLSEIQYQAFEVILNRAMKHGEQ